MNDDWGLKARGITHKDLAALCGVSAGWVGSVRTGYVATRSAKATEIKRAIELIEVYSVEECRRNKTLVLEEVKRQLDAENETKEA